MSVVRAVHAALQKKTAARNFLSKYIYSVFGRLLSSQISTLGRRLRNWTKKQRVSANGPHWANKYFFFQKLINLLFCKRSAILAKKFLAAYFPCKFQPLGDVLQMGQRISSVGEWSTLEQLIQFCSKTLKLRQSNSYIMRKLWYHQI